MKVVQQAVPVKKIGLIRDAPADAVADSIVRALAYSDLFDYPLSVAELSRYQIETSHSTAEIMRALESHPGLQTAVSRSDDGFYCLRGRESVFSTRVQREAGSAKIWKRARIYGRVISHFPFVRMITVTGALAVDNNSVRPDIDLLIVTTNGRVWITRRLLIMLVRIARLFGDDLCPNYIISQNSLSLDQRDLFTAHELAQMIPLYGAKIYRRMLKENDWAESYLPSAFAVPRDTPSSAKPGPVRRVAEWLLGRRILDRWEGWELSRLREKLRPLVGDAAEVVCSTRQCKGHTGLHRQWVTTRYEERLRSLGL